MDNFRSEMLPDYEQIYPKENSGGLRRVFIDILETVVLSVLLFLGINAISARIRVESISMQPTLFAGDFIIVNRLAYNLGEPARGDIIIFHYPPDPGREPYIKRVIGLPGDSIRVDRGKVYVNENALTEPYISAPPSYTGSWNVPDDSIFVLGDNRNSSSDSHSWGMVPLENVIGKAEVIYWPPDDWTLLNQTTAFAAEE